MGYNDHFSSSSLEQVISILFQTFRGCQTFWTQCSCLKIKETFFLPASVCKYCLVWTIKTILMQRREYPCLSQWANPTSNVVLVVLSILCMKFVSILVGVSSLTSSKKTLKLFPVVGLRLGKKNNKFSHIYSSLIFTSSALLLYVVLRKP